MTSNCELVREFMRGMQQDCPRVPFTPTKTVSDFRLRLIDEEVAELKEAIADHDMVEIADALADILYVVYGTAITYGLDIDRCFREVHRSNMTKFGPDGNPIKDATGKVTKGPNYQAPNLEPILRAQERNTL